MKKLAAALLALCFLLLGAGGVAFARTAEPAAPVATASTARDAFSAATAAEALSEEACDPTCGDETPDGPDAAYRELAEPQAGEARPDWAPAGDRWQVSHRPAPPTRPPRAG